MSVAKVMCLIGLMLGATVVPLAAMSANYTIAAGDVDDFTNKLEICNRACTGVITLSPGSYDVSKCSGVYWDTNKAEKRPDTHLAHDYITIKGATDDPRDVVVYGDGTKGIWYAYQGSIRNLTISNGYVSSSSSLSGGAGISTYTTGTKISNVVVTCCTSVKNGGGVFHGSYVDCQIVSNRTTSKGGGASGASNSSARFTRCLLANNYADKGGAANNCAFDDCIVSNNVAAGSAGALYRGSNTAAYHGICEISNTLFIANTALNGAGGAIYDDASSGFYGCRFVSNRSPLGSAGGLYLASGTNVLRFCVISNNLSRSNGGGAIGSKMSLYDCDVAFNRCGNEGTASNIYGGGLQGGKAVRCRIFGNAAFTETSKGAYSGGAGDCELVDCILFDNVAKSAGGATRGSMGSGCVFSNNVTLADNSSIYVASGPFSNCTFYGHAILSPSAFVGCRFLDHASTVTIAEGGNVLTSGTFAVRVYIFEGAFAATNCLFANNRVGTIFRNNKATAPISLVNCTVTSNATDRVFDEFKLNNSTYPVNAEVVNSIFVQNVARDGTYMDLSFVGGNLAFTNCLIGAARTKDAVLSEANTVTNANPRFVLDGTADCYALKHSSPARGRGLVQGWMTDANDIRGEGFGRLRDEKGTGKPAVDIGCYQCWLDPIGTLLLLR